MIYVLWRDELVLYENCWGHRPPIQQLQTDTNQVVAIAFREIGDPNQ